MKNSSTYKIFIASCIGLGCFGVAMLSLGAILSPLMEKVPQAASLPQYLSIGIILGTLLFGPTMDRFGYKWLFIGGVAIQLCGLLGLANFNTMLPLIVSIIAIGFGGGILNGEMNALVSDLYEDEKKRGSRLSLLGACYCIGALLWTLLCTFYTDYRIPLYGVSIFMTIFILFLLLLKFPKNIVEATKSDISIKSSLKMFTYPGLLFIAFILFFQSGFEGVSGSYFPSYFVANGLTSKTATFSLTIFTIGMLAGRLLLSVLMNKLKDIWALLIYLMLALTGVILIYIAPTNTIIIYTGMALIGFGGGATFPVMLSHLGNAFRTNSGTAFSVAIFIALCGQFTFNFVGGQLFTAELSAYYPLLICVAIVVMIGGSKKALKKIDNQNF